MTERIKGEVKWFNPTKGFGFITADGEDYFMHITHLRDNDEFLEGDECEFSIAQTSKGFAARDIIKIKE